MSLLKNYKDQIYVLASFEVQAHFANLEVPSCASFLWEYNMNLGA